MKTVNNITNNLQTILIVLILLVFIFFVYNIVNRKYEPFGIAYNISGDLNDYSNIRNEVKEQKQLYDKLKIDINSIKHHYGYDSIPNMILLDRYKEIITDNMKEHQRNISKDLGSNSIKQDSLNHINNEINNLKYHLKLDVERLKKNHDYKNIKSLNNGLQVCVNKLNNSYYNIKVNNGCLVVDDANNYDIVKCNPNDKNQQFYIDNIYNKNDFKSKMNRNMSILSDKYLDKVKYPFAFVKAYSNDNCVKNYHGKLSVEPCREYTGQRWMPL
jgi:hypothetical protein